VLCVPETPFTVVGVEVTEVMNFTSTTPLFGSVDI